MTCFSQIKPGRMAGSAYTSSSSATANSKRNCVVLVDDTNSNGDDHSSGYYAQSNTGSVSLSNDTSSGVGYSGSAGGATVSDSLTTNESSGSSNKH